LHSLNLLAHLNVFNHVHGVCEIMDAAGVFAKPSRAQDTVSLSHQTRRCCGVSCAGRRGAKWLGEKRGLPESSSWSFFSVCSRWNDGGRGRRERAEVGMEWRRLLALLGPGRRAACSSRRAFSPTASSPPWPVGERVLYATFHPLEQSPARRPPPHRLSFFIAISPVRGRRRVRRPRQAPRTRSTRSARTTPRTA
jgi:hypothetical protein